MNPARLALLLSVCLSLSIAGCGTASEPDNEAALPAYVLTPDPAADPMRDASGCRLAALAECSHTNQLVDQDDFQAAVASFLGNRRRAYVDHPDGPDGSEDNAPPVSGQMIEVLGGPPEDRQRLGPYLFFSACRGHSCPEKGFAILTPAGGTVALGIFHFWNEPEAGNPRTCCGRDPDLTIYHRPVADWQRIEPALRSWAEGKAGTLYRFEGEPQPKLRQLEAIVVTDPAS
jgi:hypothetical protein